MSIEYTSKCPSLRSPKRTSEFVEIPWKAIRRTRVITGCGDLTKMKCPECGKNVVRPMKEWDLSPKVHVKLYECCGKKFREYVKK